LIGGHLDVFLFLKIRIGFQRNEQQQCKYFTIRKSDTVELFKLLMD